MSTASGSVGLTLFAALDCQALVVMAGSRLVVEGPPEVDGWERAGNCGPTGVCLVEAESRPVSEAAAEWAAI